MNGLITLCEIEDLRKDNRAANFWELANMRVESAKLLVQIRLRPRQKCGLIERLADSKRMWDLIQSIREHGFRPVPGDEIMLAATERFEALNGTRRASILLALGRPVPAIIVDNWAGNIARRPVRWHRKS